MDATELVAGHDLRHPYPGVNMSRDSHVALVLEQGFKHCNLVRCMQCTCPGAKNLHVRA